MSFASQIKTAAKEEPIKEAPNWMSQPIVAKEPVKYAEPDDDLYWKFPELKKSNVTHVLPYNLQKAVLNDKDFCNWFETVWMVLSLNARWSLNEVLIPSHLRDKVNARSIGIDGYWNVEKNEVKWHLYK